MLVRDQFINHSVAKLGQYEQRIGVCLNQLSFQQIWWRHADTQNAIGNLVLHLCGNVRQWIIAGLGGQPDIRERDEEFAARDSVSAGELKAVLGKTVNEAVAVLEGLTAEQLTDRVTVQGYEKSILEAVYHVVEHFSHHAGQILYATKLLTGNDLGFYRHLNQPVHAEKTP
jgi:uncharacterized damage-inducible protein DinB